MLAILDYEAGNQTSVFRALKSLGISSIITADKKTLETSDGVIFPGVGAAGQAMAHLEHTGLKEELYKLVKQRKPLLGICLGCQILLDRSEEDGGINTLGILSGECLRFNESLQDEEGNPICIPHMGWNNIVEKQKSILLEGIPDNAEFYFVHSYYTKPSKDLVIATTYHGMEFCSIFGRDGLWAVQFHPEKSGHHGLKLLKNFDTYCHSQKK